MYLNNKKNSRREEEYLDFSANTSPLGVHKEASKALLALSLDPSILASYPDPNCTDLKLALSKFWNFNGQILCGSGAADLTQLISVVFGKNPSGTSFNLIIEPAFSEYENSLLMASPEEKILHLTLKEENDFKFTEEDFEHLEKILSGGVPLVFMASPSNPAGTVIPLEMLKKIASACEKSNTVLVLDSCFCQFSKEAEKNVRALIAESEKYPHLIILNAFTKIYGMAGLRLGYALCFSSTTYNHLVNFMRPWTISTDAQATGTAVINSELNGTPWQNKMIELVSKERKILSDYFISVGAKVLSGEANYILVKLPLDLQKKASQFATKGTTNQEKQGHNGPKKQIPADNDNNKNLVTPFDAPLCQALALSKIVIRGCSDFYGMDSSWYRISVNNHEQNQKLLSSLKEIFK